MPDFDKYLERHGESFIQDIIERIERNEGIRHITVIALEQRWARVMASNLELPMAA